MAGVFGSFLVPSHLSTHPFIGTSIHLFRLSICAVCRLTGQPDEQLVQGVRAGEESEGARVE